MKPILIIAFSLIACARAASAQTHQEQGVFIQGGAFAAVERHSHTDIDANDVIALIAPVDAGSTAPAGSIGAGVFLRPFLSAQADVVITGEFEAPYPAPLLASLTALPNIGILPRLPQSSTRNAELHALLAYHLPSQRRFRLALLTGVSFTRQRTRFNSDVFITAVPALPGVTPSRPIRQIDYSFVSYRRDLVIGADAEIAFGRRIAVIPQVRLVGGSGSIGIRPGAVVRWRP